MRLGESNRNAGTAYASKKSRQQPTTLMMRKVAEAWGPLNWKTPQRIDPPSAPAN